MDLVGHDGGDTGGEFACTLNLTDVSTGWTETEAVMITVLWSRRTTQ